MPYAKPIAAINFGLTLSVAGCAAFMPPQHLARAPSGPTAAEENPGTAGRDSLDLLARVHLRLHSTTSMREGASTSNNLIVASLDRFAAGYQRLGQGAPTVREAFGAQVPLGPAIPALRSVELSGHAYSAPRDEQREMIIAFRPSTRIELLGRWFDLPRGQGTAFMSHFRKNADLNATDNIGVGAFIASTLARSYGAYGWTRIAPMHGLFLGAGYYPSDTRYVVGLPRVGGLAVRYFGLQATNGVHLEEVLFSTKATNLKAIDFYSALIPIKGSDALITNGGVFAYQVPPMSARGGGFTGGVAHRKIPGVGDLLEAEGVSYIGRFFIGARFSGKWDRLKGATYGLPIGYQFRGGDGLTRNFLRIVPAYDDANEAALVSLLLEWRR